METKLKKFQWGVLLAAGIETILVNFDKVYDCFLSLSKSNQPETKLKSFGLMFLAEEI